jgi:hypothetical protein
MCTKTEVSIPAAFVDAANALIPHEGEFKNFFIELSGCFQVATVKECDCLIERHDR